MVEWYTRKTQNLLPHGLRVRVSLGAPEKNINYELRKISMLIYETQNFILESHDTPEVDRLEGGHIKISPKRVVEDRLCLTPQEVIEMTWLTQISGGALRVMMKKI